MKKCSQCENCNTENYCKIKKYFVSVQAEWCKDYKVSSKLRRKEIIDWMIDKNFIEPEDDKIPLSDVVTLMILWGDKCLNNKKLNTNE